MVLVSFLGYLRAMTSLSVEGSKRNLKNSRGEDSNLEENIAVCSGYGSSIVRTLWQAAPTTLARKEQEVNM